MNQGSIQQYDEDGGEMGGDQQQLFEINPYSIEGMEPFASIQYENELMMGAAASEGMYEDSENPNQRNSDGNP
jgi:hypothetical protein